MMPSVDRAAVGLEMTVGDGAGVEHQRAARMHDEIRRVDEVDFLQLLALEVEQCGVEPANRAVVENVDAR